MREDPSLEGVDVVIFDEFHERGTGSDTGLALCREAQRALGAPLRLVVMSATLFGRGGGDTDGGGGGDAAAATAADAKDGAAAQAAPRRADGDEAADAEGETRAAAAAGEDSAAKDEDELAKLTATLGGRAACGVLRSAGRQFPVDVKFAPRGSPPLGPLRRRASRARCAIRRSRVLRAGARDVSCA